MKELLAEIQDKKQLVQSLNLAQNIAVSYTHLTLPTNSLV